MSVRVGWGEMQHGETLEKTEWMLQLETHSVQNYGTSLCLFGWGGGGGVAKNMHPQSWGAQTERIQDTFDWSRLRCETDTKITKSV